MYKKLTALVLSMVMLCSMVVPTAIALEIETPEQPTAQVETTVKSVSADDVNFVVEPKRLPAASGEDEKLVEGDFEYEVDTSVDEVKITKYTGNDVTVVIPSKIDGMPVTKLGYQAFREKAKLTEVTIPAGITDIDAQAFYGCERLETADLPDSVERLGGEVFRECRKLKNFNYPKNLKSASSSILYNCELITSVTVPEGVTTLANYTFADNNYLQTVELPSTLKKIDHHAFRGTPIKSIVIPDSVEEIGERAFEDCGELKTVTFPSSLVTVGYAAFIRCGKLEKAELPDSVTTIYGYAFEQCKKLTSFSYPKSLENADEGILLSCESLTEVTVPDGVTTLPKNVFRRADYLEKINLPDSLTKISDDAFRDCGVKEIDIPASVKTIGAGAFWGARNLKAFVFPDAMETVSEHVIAECINLESVTLPASARTIGYEALRSCERLTEITIPENVETIGRCAFAYCKRLESITLSKKWESCEGGIFEGCENLTEITLADGMKTIPDRAFEGANLVEKINIPSTVTKIGEGAFRDCVSLESIAIPASVKTIGREAFKNTGLTEITLPDSVTEISEGLCMESANLEKVNFPKKLKGIAYSAFYKCERITSVELPDTVETIKAYAFGQCSKLESINIPKNWANAEGSIFSNCKNLKEITLPEGMTELPVDAFRSANYLEKVNMPSTLKEIGSTAFYECSGLKEVVIPDSVTFIGSSAFAGCEKLESVTFPANLQTIESEAFRNCKRLADAALPDTVETLGTYVFSDCTSLTTFNYPSKLQKVGNDYTGGLFYNCKGLTTITVPDGVKSIPNAAFDYNNYLTAVILPASITSIGERSFSNCPALREINLPTTIKEIGGNAFENDPLLTVYCPKYQKRVISFIDSKINVVSNDDQRKETPAVLDTTRSSYAMLSGSKIAVSTSYAMKTSVYGNVSDAYVRFYIPDGASIVDDSLYLDGVKLTDLEQDDNHIRVPVSRRTGRVTFTLETSSDCVLRTYAVLGYRLGNADDFDIIDIINEDYEIITLSAENIVTSKSFEIAGNAPVENEVNIYVNDVLNNSVTANKAGLYEGTVTLGAVSENERVTVRVETVGKNGDVLSASKTVRYSAAAPEMTSLNMQYNGLSYDLLSGKKHNITFVLESFHGVTPFRFTVGYKNTDKVERVYITSTRNQITKKMVANYDSALGLYVAEGWFDPANHDYVPGKIGVEYLEKPEWTPYSLKNLNTVYNGDMLPEILKNAAHEQTINEEDHKEIVITTQDGDVITYTYYRLNAEEFKKDYESNHNVSSKSDDITTMVKDYGWETRTEGNFTFYSTFDRNVSSNETIAWTYEKGKSYVEKEHISFGSSSARKLALMHVSEEEVENVLLSGLNYASTDYYEYIYVNGYIINYTKARANILASGDSQAEKNRKLDELNELRRNAIEMTAVKLIGAYLHLIGGYKFGDFPILSIIVYIIDIRRFDDNDGKNPANPGDPGNPGNPGGNDTDDNPTPPGGGETSDEPGGDGDGDGGDGITDNANTNSSYSRNSLSFSIDPSGYVYEAVTSNRVAGAKVVAYWIPFDGEDDSYWEKPDESKQVVWKADEYSQDNPLLTDNAGCYAWDVPEGWWRVVVEKDGYETATTEWMPVPPPQLDVNIPLISKEEPKIEKIENTENSITITFNKYIDPETVSTIKIIDKNGKEIEYTLDYSKDETDANGKVFAKVFTLNLKDKAGTVTLNIPETVKSYSGAPVKAQTEEIKVSDYEPEPTPEPKPTNDEPEPTPKPTNDEPTPEPKPTNDEPEPTPKPTNDEPEPKPEPKPVGTYGDVDSDGAVTANDALDVLRSTVGMNELSDVQKLIADLDGDEAITAGDALEILRYSVNLTANEKFGQPVYAKA